VNFATANGHRHRAHGLLGDQRHFDVRSGRSHQAIGVTINGDQLFEPDETFTVNLSNPVNTTIRKPPARHHPE